MLFFHAGGFFVSEDRWFPQLGGEYEAEPAGLLHRAGGHPQADGCHTCMSVVASYRDEHDLVPCQHCDIWLHVLWYNIM